jgi:hypothetical protein
MHDFFPSEEDVVVFEAIKEHLALPINASQRPAFFLFLSAWCGTGRILSTAVLEGMKAFVEAQPDVTKERKKKKSNNLFFFFSSYFLCYLSGGREEQVS